MQDNSDEALHFPNSNTIPELPSDNSLDEFMLGPLNYNALIKGMPTCIESQSDTKTRNLKNQYLSQ
jgi:hypothetical protein